MPHLDGRKIVRVFAKHEPYTDGHLGNVMAQMRRLGAPTIAVVEWRGDLFALEGSHRLSCAHELSLVPTFVVHQPDLVDRDGEAFWQTVRDTVPHYAWMVE
jgi:hypothetical protein